MVALQGVLYITCACLISQQPRPATTGPATTKPAAGPRIVFEPESIDFGEVYTGSAATKSAKIWNRGTEPLQIKSIKKGCACTPATIDRKLIQPGEFANLTVKLTVPHRKGKSRKVVKIESNDPTKKIAVLPVKMEVLVGVRTDPTTLRATGLTVGEPATIEFKLISETGHPFRILAIEGTSEITEVAYDPDLEALSHSAQLVITPGQTRYSRKNVRIRTTHPKQPVLDVYVWGAIARPMTVIPTFVRLGTVRPGEEVRRPLTVRSQRGRIGQLSAQVEGELDLELRPDPGDATGARWEAVFKIPTDLPAGGFRGTVTLSADLAKGQPLTLGYEGQVELDPMPVFDIPNIR